MTSPGPTSPPASRPPLTRSTVDRKAAGVIGGLAEHLGLDVNVLRIGFVVVSVFLTAGIGGALLYAFAAVAIPEDDKNGPFKGVVFPYRPWVEWDRTARSWALVLTAVAVACIWSFGVWPLWRWDTLPFWALLVAGTLLWALTRPHRPDWRASLGAVLDGTSTRVATAPAPPTSTQPPTSAQPPSSPQPPASPGPSGPSETGPVVSTEAEPAARRPASWDYDFTEPLVQRPVLTEPPAAPAGAPVKQRSFIVSLLGGMARMLQALYSTLTAVVMTGVLVGIVIVVWATLSSGSTFSGGVGDRTITPLSVAATRPAYHLGTGNLDVDLSVVRFPARGTTMEMTVGVGDLTVVVPRWTDVTVRANIGLGSVNVFGHTGGHVDVTSDGQRCLSGPTTEPALPSCAPKGKLTLIAHVGVGEIEISRA